MGHARPTAPGQPGPPASRGRHDPANGYARKVLGDAGASPVGPVTVDTLPLPPRRVDEFAPVRLR